MAIKKVPHDNYSMASNSRIKNALISDFPAAKYKSNLNEQADMNLKKFRVFMEFCYPTINPLV